MAVVAKWLTHRIVVPTFGGSIPLGRPIFIKNIFMNTTNVYLFMREVNFSKTCRIVIL
jgi:hypothetical protein